LSQLNILFFHVLHKTSIKLTAKTVFRNLQPFSRNVLISISSLSGRILEILFLEFLFKTFINLTISFQFNSLLYNAVQCNIGLKQAKTSYQEFFLISRNFLDFIIYKPFLSFPG